MDALFPTTYTDLTFLARAARDLLYPPCCPACGGALTPGTVLLCTPCRATLKPMLLPGPPPHLVLGAHDGPLRTLIGGFKRGHALGTVAELATRLGHLVGHAFADADALLAVPTSPRALAARGFNPARVVATAMAASSGLPLVADDVVLKTRETAKQAFLPFHERLRNVAGAFTAGPSVRGCRLVIVDDVLTTGATLEAVSRAVRAAGGNIFGAAFLSRRPLFVESLGTAPKGAVSRDAAKLRP